MNNKPGRSYKNVFLSFVFIFLMAFYSSSLFPQEQAKEKLIEYIVARVNNAVITSSELELAVDNLKKTKQRETINEDDLKKEALENLIVEKLVTTIAQMYKIEIPDDEINERIELIKKDNNITTDDELDKSLKAQGLSLIWLREQLKRGYLYQTVIMRNVYAGITVSEEEISDYYSRNIREYSSGEEVRLRQVFISTNDKEEETARQRITEAYQKLKEGYEFSQVVDLYADEKSKINSGDLGYFKKGELLAALEEPAFRLSPGEYSDIIKTDNGYHILQVTEKKIGKEIPLESVRQEIVEKIRSSKMIEASKEYINKLEKEYFVEILDPELKKKLEQLPEGDR